MVSMLPSTQTKHVQIPLKASVFSVKILFETNRNKQKETGVSPLGKTLELIWSNIDQSPLAWNASLFVILSNDVMFILVTKHKLK